MGPVISTLETQPVHSLYGMAATGTEESTRIAAEVLEAGGNAVDAAVAAAFALGVADIGDSGLGGATYIVIRFADGSATFIDGSAAMPLRADRALLAAMDAEEEENGMPRAAVPGSLMALEHAAARYGTRPLATLVEPAIRLAESGFFANSFQEVAVRSYFEDVLKSDFLKYFVLEDGREPPSTTTRQCRPVLAATLRRIAAGGSAEFYRGRIAAEIEADMSARGGFVSRSDLALYKVRETSPLRGSYRGAEVLAPPYPAMGGALIEALNILERFSPKALSTDDALRHQLFAEAFHMALADHGRLFSDQSQLATSARSRLLEKEFAAERAAMIAPGRPVVSDEFPPVEGMPDDTGDGNTTQVSVIDRWGNAVSVTQSLGRFFGNKRLHPKLGFPYNNFLEGSQGIGMRGPIPTSMCPTIVAWQGEALLVLGSSSSSRIPGIVASVISNVVDRGMGLQEAVLAPRVLWSIAADPGPYAEIFGPITRRQVDELESFGYTSVFRAELPVRQSGLSRFGSVNAVHLDRLNRVLTGVGDPRRNGCARGARL